jgi:K+/H+ antiporter YhaU regulatory subunit KhtT
MDGPVHEQELPGIGYRYDIDTLDGRLSVVIHPGRATCWSWR